MSLDNKWLTERLSEARQGSKQWTAIFEAVQEWASEGLFPEIEQLKDARRSFSADHRALNLLIDDLGDFFEHQYFDTEEERSRQNHIDLLWRRHELHNKHLTTAFESYVNRVMKLHGMTVRWEPLYWREDQDYSDAQFYPKIGPFDEHCQLASQRGAVFADISYISAESSEWIIEKLIYAMDRARKILPEHLVLESAIINRKSDAFRISHVARLVPAIMLSYATNKNDINTGYVGAKSNQVSFLGHTSSASNASYHANADDTNTGHVSVKSGRVGLMGHTASASNAAYNANTNNVNTAHVELARDIEGIKSILSQAYIAHASNK